MGRYPYLTTTVVSAAIAVTMGVVMTILEIGPSLVWAILAFAATQCVGV